MKVSVKGHGLLNGWMAIGTVPVATPDKKSITYLVPALPLIVLFM